MSTADKLGEAWDINPDAAQGYMTEERRMIKESARAFTGWTMIPKCRAGRVARRNFLSGPSRNRT